MNCFVFYVVVDGVACVPILLFRPWECLSLSLSQVGVLCVGPSVGPGRPSDRRRAFLLPSRPALCMRMSHGAELFHQNQRSHAISTTLDPLKWLIASVINTLGQRRPRASLFICTSRSSGTSFRPQPKRIGNPSCRTRRPRALFLNARGCCQPWQAYMQHRDADDDDGHSY